MTSASTRLLGGSVLVGLLWVSLLARVFTHFDPGSQLVNGWNSDAAIAVLQSNDPVFDAFRLYYYGQDRIGAWPWLLAQGWRALTGFDWTPYRVFLWQATWACGACLALLGLHRQVGWVLAASFAALILLSPLFQVQLFALSQPFGWQLTALFLAWWTLTRLLEGLAGPGFRRAAGTWGSAATLFSVLACWTSPTSGPLLLVCFGVQGGCVALVSPPGGARWRWLGAVLPVAAGIGFEAWVRHLFHRFAKRQFGHAYRTSLEVDTGYLLENAAAVWRRILEDALGPFVLLGGAVGLGALGFLLWHLRRRTLAAQAAQAGLAALTVAFATAALANACLTVLVRHARLNEHDIRYLVPTLVLGGMAAVSGVFFLLGQVSFLRARLGAVAALTAGGLVAGGHLFLRPRTPAPLLERSQVAADAVVSRAAGTVLLGGYWDTYLVGALDPAHRLPVLAVDGDYQRTPFWVPRVREAQEVLVSFAGERWAGTADQPNPWLLQFGAPFQLAEARWAVLPPFQFARYRSMRAHTLPVQLDPERGFAPCEPGASLTVRFEQPVEQGVLLVGTRTSATGVEVEAPGAAEARLEGLPSLWVVHLSAGEQPLRQVTLRQRAGQASEQCWFGGVALVADNQKMR
ncbi:hypothetical protein [Stigmatella aurantiaca]|uniref:Uncharacterized protein n=1 Tax=Stigmatella aurantiaca (strain DW4/3-1) TaxID=378806 RepID=Q08VE7_STIAD|nr:hypothetical protein [Stigmatella aurantiaca]EAU64453.1 hypothetical protein STIAU_4397 [Stigmatella aurantiaca DW4/3-1]